MLQISIATRLLCGVALVTVPTIEFGGVFLLRLMRTRDPGYVDNPTRRRLFRAGHAHAGVILILSLICQLLMDSVVMPAPLEWIVRLGVPAAAILMPLGFFFSVLQPRAEQPGGAIRLVYAGAMVLAIAVVIAGIGLIHAAIALSSSGGAPLL
jgi:predicted Abi (CAAX) family protease